MSASETEPLEFELRDDDPWHVSKSVFEILTRFVTSSAAASDVNATAGATAAELDRLDPAKRALGDGEAAEETTSFLLEFWQVVVLVAKQIPCDSKLQTRVVELVRALKALPADGDGDDDKSIWVHLEGLENVLQESWTTPSGDDDSYAPFTDWVNTNAFIARLFEAGLVPWYYLGIWTLREALEEDDETNEDVRQCSVTAAAQWILYAGPALHTLFQGHTATETETGPLSSALFAADKVLSYERWLFWQSKFDLVGASLPTAAAAAKTMAELGHPSNV